MSASGRRKMFYGDDDGERTAVGEGYDKQNDQEIFNFHDSSIQPQPPRPGSSGYAAVTFSSFLGAR